MTFGFVSIRVFSVVSAMLTVSTFAIASTTTSSQSTTNMATGGAGVHVPIGKDGDGYYTASTKGCFDVIDAATPIVLEEVAKQPSQKVGFGSTRPAFHIADYGTADGGTSLGLLTKMIQQIRQKYNDPSKEIVLHYEDQLTNEWQSVFNHALGLKSVSDAYGNDIPNPYKLNNVFVQACGVGFHNQCFASDSIDFGVSFTAMHWLSTFPSSLQGQEYMHAARCPIPPLPEKQQAAKDWKRILLARSKELVVGGRFVCVNFCVSEEAYFLGQTDIGTSMWDSFQMAWDKLYYKQELIDETERTGVSFPNYYRNKEECLNDIDDIPNLKVVSYHEKIVRCPYRELYVSGKSGKTPREYAEWYVPTTKTWSHSTFKNALNKNRTEEEKEGIMDQFWENYISLVEQEPEIHGMDYVHSYIVFEKTE